MRMLDLPNGEILFTDGGSQLYVYNPDGSPLSAGQPTIYNITQNGNGSLHITGTLFNGISQGAAYGDDAQMDSNYPLVTFTDGSGDVSYGRTYNWSATSVSTGFLEVSTECAPPSFLVPGNYSVRVIANGNASAPFGYYGPEWVNFSYNGFIQFGSFIFPWNTLASGVSAVASGGTINIISGSSTETMTITKAMSINAVNGSAVIGIGH